ncbi:NAD(P)H-binding protein [Paenibacillus sp. NPDC058174]|uniref:NAD(P)H-binding protein n=1 Tax=Paenibacillus sp. NPDC058174 TaxID=3346366 RepID=UPI0036DAF262
MSIVITGANGKLGSLIIEQLLRKVAADQIVACVRDLEKAGRFHEYGIEVRLCDYDKPDTLEQAFAGAFKLLFIASSNQDDTIRLRQHAHVIEAAKKSQVGHLLFTSFAFPEQSSISMSHLYMATEHAILTTGIPYTFLRNSLYTDFVGVLGLDAAVATGELRISPGEWSFNTVTREDLAQGIAAVLSEGDHRNKIYELTASRSWTFDDLAAALSELSGKPVTIREDAEIQNWIFGFLRKINTSSASPDLERLIGGSVTPLRESIRPFITTI